MYLGIAKKKDNMLHYSKIWVLNIALFLKHQYI
jgi:hypothetical protein